LLAVDVKMHGQDCTFRPMKVVRVEPGYFPQEPEIIVEEG
jgi:hypothetical protein